MNTQLAHSLAEAVSALSLEDFQAFQVALLNHRVKKRRGSLGKKSVNVCPDTMELSKAAGFDHES
jgi:hypothetical protein